MIRLMAAVIISVAVTASCAKLDGKEIVAQQCVLSSRGVCRLPFEYLLFKQELLSRGSPVSVKGYLQIEDEEIILYKDSEAANYRVREFSVLITGEEKHIYIAKKQAGQYVGVTGIVMKPSSFNWIDLELTAPPHQVALRLEQE